VPGTVCVKSWAAVILIGLFDRIRRQRLGDGVVAFGSRGSVGAVALRLRTKPVPGMHQKAEH